MIGRLALRFLVCCPILARSIRNDHDLCLSNDLVTVGGGADTNELSFSCKGLEALPRWKFNPGRSQAVQGQRETLNAVWTLKVRSLWNGPRQQPLFVISDFTNVTGLYVFPVLDQSGVHW